MRRVTFIVGRFEYMDNLRPEVVRWYARHAPPAVRRAVKDVLHDRCEVTVVRDPWDDCDDRWLIIEPLTENERDEELDESVADRVTVLLPSKPKPGRSRAPVDMKKLGLTREQRAALRAAARRRDVDVVDVRLPGELTVGVEDDVVEWLVASALGDIGMSYDRRPTLQWRLFRKYATA